MEIVSFKVAKAIKEAEYPQTGEYWYDGSGLCCYSESDLDELQNHFYAAPYVLEVWLWLWREKKIAVEADYSCANDDWFDGGFCGKKFNDPEEAIIAAIEHLVDNNLIK